MFINHFFSFITSLSHARTYYIATTLMSTIYLLYAFLLMFSNLVFTTSLQRHFPPFFFCIHFILQLFPIKFSFLVHPTSPFLLLYFGYNRFFHYMHSHTLQLCFFIFYFFELWLFFYYG